jgi:hypothetical protein
MFGEGLDKPTSPHVTWIGWSHNPEVAGSNPALHQDPWIHAPREAGASSASARTTASRPQRASQAPRRIRSHPDVYGTLDQEEWAEYSDHAPIIATFEADSPGSEG